MRFDDYQSVAQATKVYPHEAKIIYPALGLAGEAGEVANKAKKILRGDYELTEEVRAAIAEELGDALWYLAATASDLGYTLGEIARMNLDKLADRRDRDVIRGSGDNR
jgi:NTP pyrophosphatase (non-canonical NTP hydrolase)